jgi:hypothetical protein
LNIKAEQKYGDRGTKKIGTRLAQRNEFNLNMEKNIGTVEQKKKQG